MTNYIYTATVNSRGGVRAFNIPATDIWEAEKDIKKICKLLNEMSDDGAPFRFRSVAMKLDDEGREQEAPSQDQERPEGSQERKYPKGEESRNNRQEKASKQGGL